MPPKTKVPPRQAVAPSSLSSGRRMAAVAAVLVAAVTWWWLAARSTRPAVAIAEMDWSSPSTTLSPQELAKHGKPVLVHGSVAATWPALSSWTPQRLGELSPRLPNVYRQRNPYFRHYAKNKPFETLLGTRPTFETLNMTGAEFAASAFGDQGVDREYYYWAGPVALLGPAMAGDVEPHSPLVLNPQESYFNAWISSKGVIASCHYDMYHNFFVQVSGRKRFTLFPPSDWHNLQVFPISHPSHRQCQVNMLDPHDTAELERATGTGPIVVQVGPGDVLYLPPFWFHHVEALDASMSVNVWSYTRDFSDAHGIFKLPVPFEDDWPERLKFTAVFAYIGNLAERCDVLDTSTDDYITAMVTARFLTLRPAELLKAFNRASATSRDRYVCATPWEDQPSIKALGGASGAQALRDKFAKRSTEICKRLLKVPKAQRSILLEDFIEELVEYSAGPQNVLAYLETCYAPASL